VANTLTSLIPSAYAALDTVSRELVGMIPSVTRDATTERAAVGQTVYSPVAPASTAGDITPAVTPPDDGNQTIGNVSLSIDKARRVPIRWNGEEQRGLNNGGAGYENILKDQFTQAFRTLCNEIESDLAGLNIYASRAYGTAATTPFGTAGDYTDASNMLRILLDNGAQSLDRHLVLNTAAGANIRGKQGGKANEAGTDQILRRGVLLDIHGFAIRESAQIKTPTAGTMASATSTAAVFTVGQTVIPLATAGTGVVAAGDVVTFANDTNKYVVTSVSFAGANPASGDSITLALPGLRVAQGSATRAITVVATAARNMAFSRDAIVLACRLPARPKEGDLAVDVMSVQDPMSGLAFEIAQYNQYRQVQFEVSCAWGKKVVKAENLALLLG
jgi:hypothetical protein